MPTPAKLIWWHMLSPTALIRESKLESSLSQQSLVSPRRERVQSHKVPCCQYSVAALTCPVQKCPNRSLYCGWASPVCLKQCLQMESPGAQPPVTSHWFQFNPWLTFKNTVPFQLYSKTRSPFNLICPSSLHLLHTSSRVTCCPYGSKKHVWVSYPLPLGPLPSSRILFLPSQYLYLRNKHSLFLRTHYAVTFFLKPLLVTPLLSLCLFTTSVPLFYNCSILQLLDLIVLHDS